MTKKITVLTWMATNNDPGALESLLANLGKDYDIAKVLYIYQEDLIRRKPDARERFEGANKVFPLTTIPVSIKNPTAHREIFDLVEGKIVPMVQDEKNLVINLSSGTPAMHAVWLILYAAGAFPDGTRLVSSQKNPKTGETSCDDVDFPITTYLSELRKYEKENPKEAYYGPDSKSKARRDALEKIRVYASVQGVPLLLLGERGTGKSRLVESHIKKFKNKEAVMVACGSLDSTLADSAVFGHAKGSFTGALTDRKGYLEEANNGILFLDEIQDLPRSVQRKLLRTLQDKSHHYRRVGEDKERTANVELVCASNLPERELRQRLDPDFYDRISFYKVTLPPLRECREDVLDDWKKIWNTVKLDSSPEKAPMDATLKEFLMASNLSGNFRSLQMIAYQFVAWQNKKTTKEILEETSFDEDAVDKHTDGISLDEFCEMPWDDATERFKYQLAEYACKKFGTQSLAAGKLGCTTKTLQNALKN